MTTVADRFHIIGWSDKAPVEVEVEPEYGLDGYRAIIDAELERIADIIDGQGRGKDGERYCTQGRTAFQRIALPPVPRPVDFTPAWPLRYAAAPALSAEKPPFRGPWTGAHKAAGGADPKTAALVEAAIGPTPEWVHFCSSQGNPFPAAVAPSAARVVTVLIDAEAAPSVAREAVRVPLHRLHPFGLNGWATYHAVNLPEGAVLSVEADLLEGVLGRLGGTLLPSHRVIVFGVPSYAGWSRVRSVADGVFLLEGPPPALLRPVASAAVAPLPRISVVTISYNQGAFIEQTLRSVLEQGYPNLEYIVIDGGSNDETRDILERYRDRLSHLVIEPDDGQSDALNKGFALATGDILTWLCSDDLLEPGALFTVAAAFQRHDPDLVAGGCTIIDEDGAWTYQHHNALPVGVPVPLSLGDMLSFLGVWQKSLYFFQPETFFSRRIWERSGATIKRSMYFAMDYDLFLRFAMAGATVLHVPQTLAASRVHRAQKTNHDTMLYLPTVRALLQDYRDVFIQEERSDALAQAEFHG